MKRSSYGGLSNRHNKLYLVWYSMLGRCHNERHRAYPRYGQRGIAVCQEWQEFESFCGWALRSGYQEGLSLDRRDNNAGYSPDNCRWATRTEQNRNKRTNARVPYAGRMVCYGELEELSGVNATLLRTRIAHLGWSVEKAITTPVRARPA